MKLIAAAAVLVLGLLTDVQVTSALRFQQVSIPPVTTSGDVVGVCPSQQERDNAQRTLRNKAAGYLNLTPTQCGLGQWTRVAYLDMSDPLQTCPSEWRLNTSSGVRVCGRPSSSHNLCHGTFYSTGRTYTKVCGRVIGYQIGHPDAFHSSRTIDQPYVEGVSITRGSPRSHIWTLAGGRSETNTDCPCAAGSSNVPPSFVGNNYYCESGNANSTTVDYHLYADDPLWDGKQCSTEGTCCSGGRSPPWFVVNLFLPTTDDIEVRVCADYNTEEDTPIQLLELYIQ